MLNFILTVLLLICPAIGFADTANLEGNADNASVGGWASAWTPSTGGSNYNLVAKLPNIDPTAPSTGTYSEGSFSSGGAGDSVRQFFDLTTVDMCGGTATALTVKAYGHSSSGDSNDPSLWTNLTINDGSSFLYDGGPVNFEDTNCFSNATSCLSMNIASSDAWMTESTLTGLSLSQSDLDNLTLAFDCNGDGPKSSDRHCYVYQAYVTVTYTPGSCGGNTTNGTAVLF